MRWTAFRTWVQASAWLCVIALRAVLPAQAQIASPLMDAVRRHDLAGVKALLARGADVNAPQADGATALHWAAHNDDLDLVRALLAAKATPDVATDLGVTPLALACQNGSAPTVEALLGAGASPNATGGAVPPIMWCARAGNVDAIQALVARKANVNAREPLRDQTALMWAVAHKHEQVVRVLIAAGADVRARSRLTRAFVNRANPNDVNAAVVGEVSRGGSTPLLFAARSGDVRSAEMLLASGADVNDLAPDGTSALTMAVHGNHTGVARLLLDRGANPNIVGSGYAALHAAVLRGNLDLVHALLGKGANVNSRLRNGTPTTRGTREYFLPESLTGATPLLLAAKFLELDIMQALVAKGADPSLSLPDGTTVLMVAAGLGSETNLFDRRDRIAVLRESDAPLAERVVAYALSLGQDVNAANALGNTALHAAAKMNYPRVIAALVSKGAQVGAKNTKGETPLAVATGDEGRAALDAVPQKPQ